MKKTMAEIKRQQQKESDAFDQAKERDGGSVEMLQSEHDKIMKFIKMVADLYNDGDVIDDGKRSRKFNLRSDPEDNADTLESLIVRAREIVKPNLVAARGSLMSRISLVDDQPFVMPKDIVRRAEQATKKGNTIKFTPIEILDAMKQADDALNGYSNDAEHDALYSLREWLSDCYESPERRGKDKSVPRVVTIVDGGILQEVLSDVPMELYKIDRDDNSETPEIRRRDTTDWQVDDVDKWFAVPVTCDECDTSGSAARDATFRVTVGVNTNDLCGVHARKATKKVDPKHFKVVAL